MRKTIIQILAVSLLIFSGFSSTAQPVIGEHVNAELIAENISLLRGQQNWLALRLEHQENWHTYWLNPGDAGKPTTIDWQLPQEVSVGDIVWPTPMRIELPADLVDFGYESEIFLLIPIELQQNYAGNNLSLEAKVQWLECFEICIPGGADVSLTLPVADANTTSDPRWQEAFAQARASLPRNEVTTSSMFHLSDGQLNLLIQATDTIFSDAEDIEFIPGQHRVWDYNAQQEIDFQLSSLQLSQRHHPRLDLTSLEKLDGLLVVTDDNGSKVSYPISAEPEAAFLAGLAQSDKVTETSLALILGFALLGGLILNLMPCVFPVLSLKVISLVKNQGEPSAHQRLHGLAYTAGVIAAFLLLAGVLLVLRAGGQSIGWGFHLQTPWFVALLVYLFVILSLAMAGWIQIGARFMGAGSSLMDKQGLAGSFYTGVLASVVASPCTAPFMGAALAFAFTQTLLVALMVFVALGFGLALPFLLISFIPALSAMMPRPGRWMDTFKQLMAIPLFLTALWLLWVLSREAGIQAVLIIIAGCVLLIMSVWLASSQHPKRMVSAVLTIAAIGFLALPTVRSNESVTIDFNSRYENYNAVRLQEIREQGKPVLVNMTASWCITCLVNEKVALSSDNFYQSLDDHGVVYMKGDWTNNNPEITAVLKEYNTSGVPLYLLYPADRSQRAIVLPQLLTESVVIEAIEKI